MLCVVTAKTLEVPVDAYVKFLGPFLSQAAGIARSQTSSKVYRFLLTDMSQVDKVIDPDCSDGRANQLLRNDCHLQHGLHQ